VSAGESTRPVCAIYWDGDDASTSEYQCSRPGAFADPETARRSFAFGDEDIRRLQSVAIATRADRTITREMLDTLGDTNDIPCVVVMSGRVIGHEVIVEPDAPMPVTFPWVKP